MTRADAVAVLALRERAVEYARRAVEDARRRGDIDALARARAELWMRRRALKAERRNIDTLAREGCLR